MRDFTLEFYKTLINALLEQNYQSQTVEEYFSSTSILPILIMRHDIDRKPCNALLMAKLEYDLGIKATYYFRTINKTLKPDIIKQIADLGHEIGYHYENLCDAEVQINNIKFKIKDSNDFKKRLFELAINDFEKNLLRLREITPIKNIAMHGRPTSKWDSKLLWQKYDYKDYGITSEPYFDIDFSKVQYITDAGRTWDNAKINLRDKVDSPFKSNFKHTENIIKVLNNGKLSNRIMFNIHPEHWADSTSEWLKIWVIRKIKNTAKRIVIRT